MSLAEPRALQICATESLLAWLGHLAFAGMCVVVQAAFHESALATKTTLTYQANPHQATAI